MGDFTVFINISPLSRHTNRRVEALVDTGSTYSMMPTSMLKSMGIIPDEGEEEIFDAFKPITSDVIGDCAHRVRGEIPSMYGSVRA